MPRRPPIGEPLAANGVRAIAEAGQVLVHRPFGQPQRRAVLLVELDDDPRSVRERADGAPQHVQLVSLDIDLDAVGTALEDGIERRRGHGMHSLVAHVRQVVLAPGVQRQHAGLV